MHVVPHSPLSKKKLIISLLSTLHSHFSLSHRRFLLPTLHHLETFLTGTRDEIIETLEDPVGCGLCRRGFVGYAVAKDELVKVLTFLTSAGLWVVPWVCDLSLYSNRFVMGLWFVMWVCVLWWLYGIWTCIASIFLSTLSLWVCVLCFVVFYDVGLVDQRHFDSSGLIQYFSGGWVFDSMGFYMDFMSTTVDELATKRRWGMPKRERERKKEKERIFF